jgi:hypothetical protein
MFEPLKTRTVWKLFFVWQVEEEERWLEQMARQGWRLLHGAVRYTFFQAPPAEVRYALDFRHTSPAELNEFQALCRDAGWECVYRFGSWFYYRTSLMTAPDIYTDTNSLMERDRRVLAMLFILIGLVTLVTLINSGPSRQMLLFEIVRGSSFLAILIGFYAIFRVWRHLQSLKSRPPLK